MAFLFISFNFNFLFYLHESNYFDCVFDLFLVFVCLLLVIVALVLIALAGIVFCEIGWLIVNFCFYYSPSEITPIQCFNRLSNSLNCCKFNKYFNYCIGIFLLALLLLINNHLLYFTIFSAFLYLFNKVNIKIKILIYSIHFIKLESFTNLLSHPPNTHQYHQVQPCYAKP